MNLSAQMLVQTRTQEYDYFWLRGFDKNDELRDLQAVITDGLPRTNSLEGVNVTEQVVVFFPYREMLVLSVLERRGKRVDRAGRLISERYVAFWPNRPGLWCGLLGAAVHNLIALGRSAIDSCLDEATPRRYPPEPIELGLQAPSESRTLLDRTVSESSGLPNGWDWAVASKHQLAVDFGPTTSFAELAATVASVDPSAIPIAIARGLRPTQLDKTLKCAWVVGSVSESREFGRRSVCIYDGRGKELAETTLSQIFTSQNRHRPTGSLREPEVRPIPEMNAIGGENGLVQAWLKYALDSMVQRGSTEDQNWISSLFGIHTKARRNVAQHCAALGNIVSSQAKYLPGETLLGWQNLLNEIGMFYPSTSPEVTAEWARRLDAAVFVTRSQWNGRSPEWIQAVSKVARQLAQILQESQFPKS